MRVVTLFIEEPRALDAFAYQGFLFLLTFDGEVVQYPIANIIGALDQQGEAGLFAAYALFSSKGIGATAEMKEAWRGFDYTTPLSLRVRSALATRPVLTVEALSYTDLRIYFNQLFLATDVGTFRVPLDAGGLLVDDSSAVQRLVSVPTESLSVGLAAVGASLGDNGLAVFLDVDINDRLPENRVESRSLRSSIGWGQAVNYPTHDSYEILETTIEAGKSGRGRLHRVSEASNGVSRREGSYALWESGRLLVADERGTATLGRTPREGRRRLLSDAPGGAHSLSIGVTGNRWVVTESSRCITVGRGDMHTVLHDGEAVSVRTFQGSHRYRRLIVATVEGGLILGAVFGSEQD